MNPLRLRASNYRTFETLDLRFDDGLVGILGELRDAPEGADSNGAGKSSILEAIAVCLFGRRSLQGLRTRGATGELMLELTFEHAGHVYRVRRRAKSKTVPPDFEKLDGTIGTLGGGEQWLPLTCGSKKETDELICQTLGLSSDTYRNSSYLAQGDGSYADPARDPAGRKRLLVEAVLGRDPIWPRLEKLARDRRKAAQFQIERVAGETVAARVLAASKPGLLAELARLDAAAASTRQQLETADAELAAIVQRYQAARDGAARRQTLQAELSAAMQTLQQLVDADAKAKAAATQLTVARGELDALPALVNVDELVARERALIDQVAEHERAKTAHVIALQLARTAEAQKETLIRRSMEASGRQLAIFEEIGRLKSAAAHEARCDRCEQLLPDEARAVAIASMTRDAEAQKAEAERLQAEVATIEIPIVPPAPDGEPPTVELTAVRAQLGAAQQAQQQRVRLDERIRALAAAVQAEPDLADRTANARALVTAKQAELDELEPVDVASIEHAGALARERANELRQQLELLQADLVRYTERRSQVEQAEQQLAAAAAETERLQALVDRDVLLERACGRDGIPALIIENGAVPYLETEATRILAELGTSYRVELRTQAELKDGTGLRDTLEVVVLDDTGEAPYDDFSGGEQTRVGLALRIALAELLATRRGAASQLLALDEPSYLDTAGMTALLRVLQDLVDRSVFRQVVLVSHVAELRDSLDQTIVVVKENGRSRVEGANVEAALEEIAA